MAKRPSTDPVDTFLDDAWHRSRERTMVENIATISYQQESKFPLLVQTGKAHVDHVIRGLSAEYGWCDVTESLPS
jgi:hypothetical protein